MTFHKRKTITQMISIGTSSLPNDGHQNSKEARGKHSLDPLTSPRRVGDWGCLYSKFTIDEDVHNTSTSISEDVLDNQSKIRWHLGGDTCNGLMKCLSGYMHCSQESRIHNLVN